MAALIYSFLASLDGYVADGDGDFGWAAPDEEVHAFVNDVQRRVGTHLYGRRLYEVMTGWETDPGLTEGSAVARDFARLWQAADKIVYSTTLESVSTTRTRLERRFDPAAVRRLLDTVGHDVSVGGPTLAAYALRAGLVDEVQVFVAPVVVGGGTRMFPDDVRVRLDLLDERRFGNGMVFLRYRATT
ncbi:MAG TPA: dihydrofolate reductase family protein [Actinocatenispora sp.]